MNLSFIIIASLPIKGMKTIGNIGLLKYQKTTILDKQILNITKVFPKAKIIVVGGFESKKIQKIISQYSNVKFVNHKLTEQSNEAESFFEAIRHVDKGGLIVYNISTIFNKTLLSKLDCNSKKSYVLINNHRDFNSNIGAIVNNGCVENIFYNLPNKIANMYYLGPQHIRYAKSLQSNLLSNKYLFELINILNGYEKFTYKTINLKHHYMIYNIKDYQQIEGNTNV